MLTLTYQTDTSENVSLSGPLDAVSISANRDLGAELATLQTEHIVLDLKDVPFMDASGLGLLSYLFKRLTETGRSLELANVQVQPLGFLNRLGVASIFGLEAIAETGALPGIALEEAVQQKAA
ncbi:STAS domain-containing protein [Aestuariispira insulae]|uniref:Anti-anti-sigma factor n=1 Tax=Aestuariispira insulae TaxID=1461337 RepID=A0A3D9H2Q5_9PROT|nr:STAS domain-containing protein [Aestuariispira insulae]RED43798.1 anti-anti-sigma factor [Aestuariispira insulae]